MYNLKFLLKKAVSVVAVPFLVVSSVSSFSYAAVDKQSDLGVVSSFNTLNTFNTFNASKGEKHYIYAIFNDALNIDSVSYKVDLKNASDNQSLNEILSSLENSYGLEISKAIDLPDKTLENLEDRANDKTGIDKQYYLNDFMKITINQSNSKNIKYVANALKKFTKYVYIGEESDAPVPAPGDISPITPDMSNLQNYWEANPGMNFTYAYHRGVSGSGVKLSDCEYSWDLSHEDLVDKNITVGFGTLGTLYQDHGTAALGISAAGVNGYGINGAAPNSSFSVYSETGGNRAEAISAAIRDSKPGDVVLMEMQTWGPTNDYVPAEYDPVVWNIVKAGTDAGVVVVAAAGNGSVNLDDTSVTGLAEYKNRGDSGAIIIGAGTDDTNHDKCYFSTYGSRVNVQTWGQGVTTLGYNSTIYDDNSNSIFTSNDIHQTYTRYFNGTSSASALAAAACVTIQSYIKNTYGTVLTSTQLRDLLVSTGIAQGTGGHIGPFVNIRAAIEKLDSTIKPAAPTNVRCTSVKDGKANLEWDLPANNAGIDHYNIFADVTYSNGQTRRTDLLTSTTDNKCSAYLLGENTIAKYFVIAVGTTGNISDESNYATVSTDNVAPSAPANLIYSNLSDKAVTLAWDAATDNFGVTGYDIYNGTQLVGTSTTTQFNVTGLTSGTQYNFTVKAKDLAGNISNPSNAVIVTTENILGNIKIQAYNVDKNASTNQISPNFKIINTGSTALNLKDIKLRYYFTYDGVTPLAYDVDYSDKVSGSKITSSFVSISATQADRYLCLGFSDDAGTLAAGDSITIQGRLHDGDWNQNFTQTNDYSFDANSSALVDSTKVTGWVKDTIKWGIEP